MGKGSLKNIIILHGWGLSGDKYSKTKSILQSQGFNVYSPDLPGFGKEILKKDSFTLDDYSEFLENYIAKNKLNDIILIGHSFGGRVIIKYLSRKKNVDPKVWGIIISGSPLVREKIAGRKKIITWFTRHIKIFNSIFPKKLYNSKIYDLFRKITYRIIGEMDYYKASQKDMKKTFLNIIGENQEENLKKINIPTLVLWGKEDKTTPVSIGIKIHRLINNSRLKVFDNETHKMPYENPEKFASEALKFINSI